MFHHSTFENQARSSAAGSELPPLNKPGQAPKKPPVILRERDLPALLAAAFDDLMSNPRIAGALLEEIDRALVVSAKADWTCVVVPGSKVLYQQGLDQPPRWTTLVMPASADKSNGMLSVLTTLGAGLLGLSKGQSISWDDRQGGSVRLEIIDVIDPVDRES